MRMYHILEEALIRELEADENLIVPSVLYLEEADFAKLRSQLVNSKTGEPLKSDLKAVMLTILKHQIEVRCDSWQEPEFVH